MLGSRVVVLSHNHNYLTPTALPYDAEELVRPVVVGRRDEDRTRELMDKECSFMTIHKCPPEDV